MKIVAVPVVEGEASEPAVVAVFQSLRGGIERQDVEPGLLHLLEHRIEKFRRDLEDAIWGESSGTFRFGTHMVEGEDHAYGQADLWLGRDARHRLMDTFFAQKARQFAALGIKDIFDTRARAFYRGRNARGRQSEPAEARISEIG